MQHSLDPDSKITMGHLSPGRLTPNLFLGINLENIGGDRNNITLEWSNFSSSPGPPQHLQSSSQQLQSYATSTMPTTSASRSSMIHSSNLLDPSQCLNLDNSTSSYDDIKFLNVDQFNMDSFKTDCILNMDHAIILDDKTMNGGHSGAGAVMLDPHGDLDIHSTLSLHDSIDKSSPLMDLEKPIMNINLDNLHLHSHSQCDECN